MEMQLTTETAQAIAPWLLAMLPAAAGAVGSAVGGIFGNKSRRKEADKAYERQQALMDKAQSQQLDMWNKTNYSAQRQQMESAGLNPALMYGMGGGGGTTTGSAGAPSVQQADIQNVDMRVGEVAQLALMNAQRKNIEADTKAKEAQAIKTEADANKTVGVDTALAEENVKNQKFLNAVNEAVGVGTKANKESAESEVQQLLMERMNADWETFKAVGYGDKPFDSAESLAGKIIEAGYLETIERIKAIQAGIGKTNAEKAKIYQNKVIDGYKEKLVEKGINPEAGEIQKAIIDGFYQLGTPREFKDKVNNFIKDKYNKLTN